MTGRGISRMGVPAERVVGADGGVDPDRLWKEEQGGEGSAGDAIREVLCVMLMAAVQKDGMGSRAEEGA